MRSIFCLLLLTATAVGQESPLTRLGCVSFTVADIEKTRKFYQDILGLEEVYALKHSDGAVQSVFFKVNDDQYLEFSPGNVEGFRLDRISLLVSDRLPAQLGLVPAVGALAKKGLRAGPIAKTAEGDMAFMIRDPDRMEIRFVRRLPGSLADQNRGKGLSEKRISDHLHHVALTADHESESLALYRDALGMAEFSRGGPKPDEIRWINLSVPGKSGDLIELMTMASLPPEGRQHIGFEVSNIQQTYQELTARGLTDRNKPFAAAIGRWIWFIRDPNNIRIEFMGQPTDQPAAK